MNKPTLVAIKHAFGERIVENSEIEKKYNLPNGWIFEKTGKEQGYAWDNGQEAPILASQKCLEAILEETKIPREHIKEIFGTTNPITGEAQSLTHSFAEKVGLGTLKISDESFGCGGAAIGINSMCEWFKNQPANTYALYVTQDWSTKMVRDRNVEALFSDAVCISLWSNTGKGILEIEKVFAVPSNISDESLGIADGFWHMDGKEVSEATFQVLPCVAKELKIDLKDFSVIPHQPNFKLLESIEQRTGINLFKDVSKKFGNPTCSGALVGLDFFLHHSPDTSKNILLVPFGAGGTGGIILKFI